jgi:selenophosphate synthetase-related protein
MKELKAEVNRALDHMLETNGIRRKFWQMDDKVKDLRYGIRQGDDAVIVGDAAFNMEGPYPLDIGRKTGLIHTCSDIVIMGARPQFAFNAMQVDSIPQALEVAEDVKKQSIGLGVPILGGNTQLENKLSPCISFSVYGRLIANPVPDSGAVAGDSILMLGEVVEGSIGERIFRAKNKFETYLEILKKKIKVNASKDCSRGGWFGNLSEILVKSQKGCKITSIPYPRFTRYMGTYLISVPEGEVDHIIETAAERKCPLTKVGMATEKQEIKIGGRTLVTETKMKRLIRTFPYKKPRATLRQNLAGITATSCETQRGSNSQASR